MSSEPLHLAVTHSDRSDALLRGIVKPACAGVSFVSGNTDDLFFDLLNTRKYAGGEMSLAAYSVARSRGREDLIALPVFLSRMFRHASIYVRNGSAFGGAGDLRGRRVGVPDYQMTACVWVRHALSVQYGVLPTEIHWFVGGLEAPSLRERISLRKPPEVRVEPLRREADLVGSLESGELDAVITPRAPRAFAAGAMRRLFETPRVEERRYFEMTRVFPIMHTFVLRTDALAQRPELAHDLFVALVEAKRVGDARLAETDFLPYGLAWMVEERLDELALFGDDPWPYGLEKNRPALDVFCHALADQGLVEQRPSPDQLFVPVAEETC